MKLTDTCIDCLLSRVVFECQLVSCRHGHAPNKTVSSCRDLLESLRDFAAPPPADCKCRAPESLRDDRESRSVPGTEKAGMNRLLEVCRKVRGQLHTFRDLVLASVIGNTFDYAVKDHDVTTDFSRFFAAEFEKGLDIDDTDDILELCSRVVYLTDNCGEIVFDRLLVGFLKAHGSHVTVAVTGCPDPQRCNHGRCPCARIRQGCRLPDHDRGRGGDRARSEKMPADLAKAIDECTIIISKGMANYESLSEYRNLPPVAYLMCVKCEMIAEDSGIARGSKIAKLRCNRDNFRMLRS